MDGRGTVGVIFGVALKPGAGAYYLLHCQYLSPAKSKGLVKIPRIFLALPNPTSLARMLDKSALYDGR
jgi:hypothetical protein